LAKWLGQQLIASLPATNGDGASRQSIAAENDFQEDYSPFGDKAGLISQEPVHGQLSACRKTEINLGYSMVGGVPES
jgi:hypothetical protein